MGYLLLVLALAGVQAEPTSQKHLAYLTVPLVTPFPSLPHPLRQLTPLPYSLASIHSNPQFVHSALIDFLLVVCAVIGTAFSEAKLNSAFHVPCPLPPTLSSVCDVTELCI
jgi:hypothetical protein